MGEPAPSIAPQPAPAPGAALATGARVVRDEAAALLALADSLGAPFEAAVDLLAAAAGRVVVSGMGKAGHVARKVAATLASTGTPAHFVHPAEAAHGDLGQMIRGDAVLCLSNSGETPELGPLVAHTRRFAIPLVAVAGRERSALARAADLLLLLPPVPEACGIGVVPTTSTAMMLALGDALAVALMERRAFSPQDFRLFHPGGRLGARLRQVRDLMHGEGELPLVDADAPMAEALLTMTRAGFGVAGVTQGGRLAGVITDGDLRRHMAGLLDRRAGEVMTRDPLTVAPDALAEEALGLMNARRVTSLFVVDPGEPERARGLIHVHDCLRAGLG